MCEYKVLVRKPEWKMPLGSLRCRWEVVKMDPKRIWVCGLDSPGWRMVPPMDSCGQDGKTFVSINTRDSLLIGWLSVFEGLFSMESFKKVKELNSESTIY